MTTSLDATGMAGAGDAPYVLVFTPTASALVRLPPDGAVTIGRALDAEIQIHDDVQVSRRHARITLARGEATLTDLDSHNGTLLNGVRLAGTHPLGTGDAITIGGAALVFHRPAPPPAERRLADAAAFRRRLEEEIERSCDGRRPLVVAAFDFGDPTLAVTASARGAIGRRLRGADVLAVDRGQLLLLMPELTIDRAATAATALVAMFAERAPAVRAGLAIVPSDGCDADTLLAGLGAAIRMAQPGELVPCARAATTMEIGEHRVVVAEPAMTRLYALLERLARADVPVLLRGETGAGKEIAAAALHHGSARRGGPLVAINCAALQDTLVESELFGYEKGAFSGAAAAKAGLFESAAGGTVFLDEIGELSAAAQAKLLRALETKRITRVGALKDRPIDVRLDEEVKAGRFREDLFFRIGAATVVVPPLRDRPRELPLLASRFLDDACARLGRGAMSIAPAAMRRLAAHRWPGNVRELKNVMDVAAVTAATSALEPEDLPEHVGAPPASEAQPPRAQTGSTISAVPANTTGGAGDDAAPASAEPRPIADELRELERARILEALAATGGHQRRAAERIGMPLRTFLTRLKQLGLQSSKR